MNKQIESLYAFVRFRPVRETEEFANVGVVLCAPKEGFFDYRLVDDSFSRVTSFFYGLDDRLLAQSVQFISEELQRVKTLVQENGNAEAVQRLFIQATKGREGVIFFSAVRPCISNIDVGGQLNELCQQIRRPYH
ncbi:MAG: DUF3037 domain-containing protein [Aeromonas sp.]